MSGTEKVEESEFKRIPQGWEIARLGAYNKLADSQRGSYPILFRGEALTDSLLAVVDIAAAGLIKLVPRLPASAFSEILQRFAVAEANGYASHYFDGDWESDFHKRVAARTELWRLRATGTQPMLADSIDAYLERENLDRAGMAKRMKGITAEAISRIKKGGGLVSRYSKEKVENVAALVGHRLGSDDPALISGLKG